MVILYAKKGTQKGRKSRPKIEQIDYAISGRILDNDARYQETN